MKLLSYVKGDSKNRIIITGLLVFQCVAVLSQIILFKQLPSYRNANITDLKIYYRYSLDFLNGEIPFLDFKMEYPPLALPAFNLPHLLSGGKSIGINEYVGLFLVENTLFTLFAGMIICCILSQWRPEGRPVLPLFTVFSLTVAALAPILPWRYDMFPALLTILAFLCIIVDKPMVSGFFWGLAVIAKLYPLVFLAVLGIYFFAKKDIRSLLYLGLGVAVASIILIPFFISTPNWMSVFFSYHQQRGLQIESLASGLLLLMHSLGVSTVYIVFNYGALHIVSTYSGMVLKCLPFIAVIAFCGVLSSGLCRFRQEQKLKGAISHESLTAYCVMVLLVFIMTNKVFSPQYMVWLLPFAALLKLRHSGLLLIICVLTIIIFPFKYRYIVNIHVLGVLLLNMRNLLVVILFFWMLIEYLPIIRPDYTDAYYNRAQTLPAKGNKKEALVAGLKALNLEPKNRLYRDFVHNLKPKKIK